MQGKICFIPCSERGDITIKSEKYDEDTWFKLLCFYHAKTELYDRSLTDLRDRYDPTSAFIVGDDKKWSNAYAIRCYEFIRKIASRLRISSEVIKADKFGNKYRFSAQGWIDTYKHLVANGEMDFIDNIQPKVIRK